MKVADRLVGFEDSYEADPDNPAMPKMKADALAGIGLVDAARPVTLRDMLTHSSGMGQGPFSMSQYDAGRQDGQSLAERVDFIASLPLDFQPGTHTGYSVAVAYDVLGRVVEIASGVDLDTLIRENICGPLGCEDLGFALDAAQRGRLARLYEATPAGMVDVSDTEAFWQQVTPLTNDYYSGSAGMLGTVADYDRMVRMLARGGALDGVRILKSETVEMMSMEASDHHLEMCPGMTCGIGMAVSEASEKIGRPVGRGTFGWSGAYGTHFYIDRKNDITVTLGVSCSNIGCASSAFSRDVERVVTREFGNGTVE